MLNTANDTTQELIALTLSEGRPLFFTVRDESNGFTTSRAMLFQLPEGDYIVQTLFPDEKISTAVFGGSVERPGGVGLVRAIEVGQGILDRFVTDYEWVHGITTQLTNRIHRLDIY